MLSLEINSAIELIRNPERMNRNTLDILRKAIKHYPYYQSLYLLLLQNLYKVHDNDFGPALKEFAVMIADRSVLFDMIEGNNYYIPAGKIENEESSGSYDGDRTLALIDNFLHTLPDMSVPSSYNQTPTDPFADYSAYLEKLPDFGYNRVSVDGAEANQSQEERDAVGMEVNVADGSMYNAKVSTNAYHASFAAPQSVKNGQATTNEHVDNVKEAAPLSEKVESILNPRQADISLNESGEQAEEEEFTVSSLSKRLSEEDEPLMEDMLESAPDCEYFTETMAGIYIKQQKYPQALEIIRTISADNPKKSVYFADQIRYLELLIRINKNKE